MPTHERRDRNDVRESGQGHGPAARQTPADPPGVVPARPGRPPRPGDVAALQRSAGNAAAAAAVQRSSVQGVLRGAGQPLEESVRGEMESRFGTGFGDVRLHTGAAAQRSAAEIGARAYTAGNHVVIGRGGADKHTLAHELTHVVQQRSGPVSGTDSGHGFALSDPGDRFERAAEANAHRVMAGPAPDAADRVQRAPDPAGGDTGNVDAVQRAMNTPELENATVTHFTPTKAGTGTAQNLTVRRPRRVTGDVQKTGTKGRAAAPNPIAVKSLQKAYKGQAAANQWKVPSDRDVWFDLFSGAGYDRGHIMGLEVGGGDVSENIVPQWSLNQGTGMWRTIEIALADLDSGTVEFVVHYATSTGNSRSVMVPTRIDIYHSSRPNGTYGSWNNEPDTNDLIRAGHDPRDVFNFYNDAMSDLGHQPGDKLSESQMHDFALKALGKDRADMLSQIDYHDKVAQGEKAGDSTAGTHEAGMTRTTVPSDKRKKLIENYLGLGLVTKTGSGDQTRYELGSTPPTVDGDSGSSSGSDVEMDEASQESQSPGQTFLSLTFDSQSSDEEYRPQDDDRMSTSP